MPNDTWPDWEQVLASEKRGQIYLFAGRPNKDSCQGKWDRFKSVPFSLAWQSGGKKPATRQLTNLLWIRAILKT